jgi:hypothetical protein
MMSAQAIVRTVSPSVLFCRTALPDTLIQRPLLSWSSWPGNVEVEFPTIPTPVCGKA